MFNVLPLWALGFACSYSQGVFSAVSVLNRVVAMVLSNDLMFLSNTDAFRTSGGGMYVHAEASSLPL